MALCDQVEDDLSMFFDLDEMATIHNISGKQISVVIDNDQGQRNSIKAPGGVYDGNLLFFAKTSELPTILPDSMITFDGVPYQVVGVVSEEGMSQVTLRAGMGGF